MKNRFECLPKKIFYFSDGAASQYKNRKNFNNLCHHQADFGVTAEWHFSATSHGKGACDGRGGTVKRLATRTSLQRPYENQIMTPFQLFHWTSESIPRVTFNYCSMEEYENEKSHLEKRFQKSKTSPGTRSLHSFVPTSKDTIQTRRYSMSSISKEHRVTVLASDLELDHVSGYVTCAYKNQWWVACVLQTDSENVKVKLTLLHPHGPCQSFKYPTVPDLLTLPLTDILTLVKPRTTTGRVLPITQKDSKIASDKLSSMT